MEQHSIYYGNGTNATYDYDLLQRLEHLTSYTSGGDTMQEIDYTFDGVNNITQILNSAGSIGNGLGGNYESNYTYDKLYRLTKAVGFWNNSQTYAYELYMDYSSDGRIISKSQTAMQLLNGNPTSISYENSFTYNNSAQPHTLTHVDDNGTVNQDFEWDANGNLTTHNHEFLGSRKLCWDEENRIMGVADDNFISYYMYDAGGERTYKLTGAFQDMIINGQQYNYNLMNNPTLYTSPYLVATPQGYTKHFYAGSERILSKIGCGGLERLEDPIEIPTGESKSGGSKAASQPPEEPDPEPLFTPIKDKIVNSNTMLKRVLECLGKDPEIIWDNLITLYKLKEIQCEKEEDLYYYHPDHLGSGTWITYTDGSAIQHLHYLPYGEEQIDQRLTSFNSRYTFSAKEKDIETGYSYFGARYYTSDLSIWLSVDPMSDKYPSMSPYNYCANNPVILHDPNGMDFDPVVDEEKKTITINAVYYATNDNKEKLKKGVDAWNAQSGKYTYTTGEGDEQKTYSVNFNLTVDPGDYKTAGEAQAAVKQDGKSNYFTVGEPELKNSRGETHFGNNIIVRNSAPERTVIHELGHTLGVGEGNEGVMESGGDSGLIIDSNVISVLQRAGISSNTQNCDVNVSEKAQPVRTYNMKGSFNNR